MAEKRSGSKHAILFPFMAQGHIIPFLALASELEKRGCDITFVSTPLNVKNLISSFPPSSSSSIRFRAVPFKSSDHDLPPNTENTDNLPHHLIFRLIEVSVSLKPAFGHLVRSIIEEELGTTPLCIIGDLFFGWMAEIAREYNIYHSIFVGSGGFGMAIYYSLWSTIPRWKLEGSDEQFDIPDFPEAGKIHVTQLSASLVASNGSDSWSVFLAKRLLEWRGSNGILFNTVEEIDKVGLGYFRRNLGLPVYPIGPFLSKKEEVTSHECLEWLDKKPPNSVLYICFGTQNTLTKTQMMELAIALEVSKKPFIWVVRPPLGIDRKSDFNASEWLPKGFEQRIQDQKMGLLLRRWAPQVEILSRNSVGGFISHCGWNSILEAIRHGVPILGWPMSAEQFFNAKFLEDEVRVCMEMGRGNACAVKHGDLARKIEMVMGENETGVKIRKRARQVREIIQGAGKKDSGLSVKAMDEFLDAALAMKLHKSSC